MLPTNDQHIKKENGRYYLRYRANGLNLDGVLLQADNELDAQQEKLNIIRKYLSSDQYEGPRTRVIALVPQYLRYQQDRWKIGKLKERSYQEKEMLLMKFIVPFFGEYVPSKITKSKWIEFTQSKHTTTIKNFVNIRKVLTNFLVWCRDPENGGYVTFVPLFELPEHEVREGKVLTQEQIDGIHDAFEHPDSNQLQDIRDIWRLLSVTGCRKMEIQGLSWDRVDLKLGRITTKESESRTKKRREIPIPQEALNILKRRYADGHPVYVFVDRAHSRPYNHCHFKNVLKNASTAVGLKDIQFKDLRSTFASVLIENGVSADDLIKFLGHSKEILESKYLKNHVQATNRVVENIESAVEERNLAKATRRGLSLVRSE